MSKIRIIFCCIGILCNINLCFAQSKKPQSDSAKFNKYVALHSSEFTFDGITPKGTGWEMLEKQFAENQFVGWGEYHNSPLISQLSSYALQAAAKYQFKTWCVEVSPYVATELTRISKTNSPYDSLKAVSKAHPDYGTFPFFKTSEDAQMIAAAEKYKFAIWGIDQEFQMAFPYVISRVYNAQSAKVQKDYHAVHDSLLAKWWMPSVSLLDSLKKVTKQEALRKALEDVKTSRTIYYESDNEMRRDLMKRNFYQYYDHTGSRNEKVFFKMGANHLAKGLNLTTHLYDIGNALYELAQRNQTGFSNIYFINRFYTQKGKLIDDLQLGDNENPKELLQLYNKEKWIVVDLRPFRYRFNNDKTLSEDTYLIIDKYDFVVVSPEIMK